MDLFNHMREFKSTRRIAVPVLKTGTPLTKLRMAFMFLPFVPSTHKSVLHILRLVCWAPTQYQNKPLLELNGFEQRPIAALIKSCFEIMINLQGTKSNIFLAQSRWGHSKTKLQNNNPELCWEDKIGPGWEGKNTPSPASQRIEWRDSNWLCNSNACP